MIERDQKVIGFVGPVLACMYAPGGCLVYNRWTKEQRYTTDVGARWIDEQLNGTNDLVEAI